MDDIVELERRITAALMRIDRGLDAVAGDAADRERTATAAAAPAEDEAQIAEIMRLTAALSEEKVVTAQLQERLRALKERDAAQTMPLEAEIERLTLQLDVQGLEVQRLKKTVVSLREELRGMTEAMAEGRVEPHLINRAMLTELEALRALRAADAAELDEILLALDPLAAPAVQEGADTDA